MACTVIETFELAYAIFLFNVHSLVSPLTFILKHQYAYSPYCSSLIRLGAVRENLFDNHFL